MLRENNFKINSKIRNKINETSINHKIFVEKKVKDCMSKTKKMLREEMFKSAQNSLDNDYVIAYKPNGGKKPDLGQNGKLTGIVDNNYNKAIKELKNLSYNLPDVSQQNFILSCSNITENVIADIIKNIADIGVKAMFGRQESLISANVKRVVQTIINRTAGSITLDYAIQSGYEYVLVSGHFGARYNATIKTWSHVEWQGDVYKIKGADKDIRNLEDATGFPNDPGGLLGWNCRHSFSPYKLGMPNAYKNFTNKDYSEDYKKIAYQRTLEKNIRQTQRELNCLSLADKTLNIKSIKNSMYTTKTKLARQKSNYKKYCAKYGLRTSDYNLK
jgi:hypothetical protein